VFEVFPADLEIPRVVLEFKTRLSTHDVITYSAKARRHKQIYPYLRYGVIVERKKTIPKRFFVHNEALDFCVAAGAFSAKQFPTIIAKLVKREVATSRELDAIAFGNVASPISRRSIVLEQRRPGDVDYSSW
jgi:hypothetical protein